MPQATMITTPEWANFSDVWGSVDNDAINEVKHVVEELRDEVREVRVAIRGDDLGQRGILGRVESVEKEQDRIERIVEAMERSEKKREEETKTRETKREKFQNRVYGLLAVTLTGIVVSVISNYLTTGFGGG